MAKVELKQPIVAEISENIKDAQSVVLVDYRGLTVEQDTKLRKLCRENGVTYKVYKNTMMNFAFKGTQFEALAPYLEGPSAAAISTTDATAPARVLGKFAKEADKLEIKGGVVEGIAYDAAGIANIATIPSREELLSKLLGSMQSPITNFARVIKQIAEVGPNKVKVIKVVREATGLGLKEAKDVVDGAPKVIKEAASKEEADDIKAKLEAEGAKVTLK